MRTISSQCHSNLILVPPHEPPNFVMGIYHGKTFDLKARVYLWTRMYVTHVEYGKIAHMFYSMMWFLQSVTENIFRFNGVIWCIIALFLRIGILA